MMEDIFIVNMLFIPFIENVMFLDRIAAILGVLVQVLFTRVQ